MQKIQSVFILGFFLLGGVWGVMGQTIEAPGPPHPDRTAYKARESSHSRSSSKKTLSLPVNSPFFDDFSSGVVPDSMHWDLKANPDVPIYPNLTIRGAVEPPSLGVATFDGASPINRPYEIISIRGPADRLESHYIDLTGADAGDNIWLTFFLQPQGVGHAPSDKDTFKVYLNTVSGVACDQKLETVYTQVGTGLKPFQQISIPIDNVKYFHEEFFMVFENVGFLTGLYSQWHLDYVKLGKGRSVADTFHQDRSVCYLRRPPMDPYTAIPYQQYSPGTFMKDFDVVVSNLKANSESLSLLAMVTDPVGGNISPAYNSLGTSSVSGYSHGEISISAFSDIQSLLPDTATFFNEISFASGDDVPQNNVLRESYRIDTLFAYDDGEADFPYGLSRARGFGQQFDIVSEDSIIAVWISFAPQIDFVRSKSMEGQSFRLVIWDDPHPDSIYYRQSAGMQVAYGDGPNHFERYRFSRAISLKPGTYWIGIVQFTDASIGVGFDKSYINNNLVCRDSAGEWVASRENGTLMIRPEMRNLNFNMGPFVSQERALEVFESKFVISPNPIQEGVFRLDYTGAPELESIHVKMVDIQGKNVWQSEPTPVGFGPLAYSCPDIPSGIYFLRIEGTHRTGKDFSVVKKLVIK